MAVDVMSWVSVTSVLMSGAVSLLAYWIWMRLQFYKSVEKMGLSGPPPNFLTGNTTQATKTGLIQSFLNWNKKYGRCYGIYFSNTVSMVTTDLDILREVFTKQFIHFPNRANQRIMDYKPWSDSLVILKDDHWKHVRSQLTPTFSSGKVKKMMPAVERVTQNLDKHIREKARTGEEVELKALAASFALDTIAGTVFGLQVDSLANPSDPFNTNALNLLRPNSKFLSLVFSFQWVNILLRRCFGITFFPAKPTQFFYNILTTALKERRLDPKSYNDYIQLMVDIEREGGAKGAIDPEIDHSAQLTTSGTWNKKGMTDNEVIANGLLFFSAGYDTVSTAMSFTLFALANHPEAVIKAQQEIDEKLGSKPVSYDNIAELTYIDMCLNEGMRLYPPGFILNRQVSDDVKVGPYQMKKGMRVMIPVWSIHRDPEYWSEPEKFIPERHTPEARANRHPLSFLPFGYGPRNCIGMRLAQLEIRMALATILQHYTPVFCDKSVYPPKVDPPQLRLTASDGLWVKFKPRA